MRNGKRWILAGALGLILGCAGLTETETETETENAVEEDGEQAEAAENWTTTGEAWDTVWLDAGVGDGIHAVTPVTLLGADAEAVVGFALVDEAEASKASLEILRLADDIEVVGLPARFWQVGDAAVIASLPVYTKPSKPRNAPARAAQAPAVPAPNTSVGTLPTYSGPLPEKLQHAKAEKRHDALAEYERDDDATALIVHMMINDTDYLVRQKAWRMIRVRWKKGIGNGSEHAAAAHWMAANGPAELRAEAAQAIRDFG